MYPFQFQDICTKLIFQITIKVVLRTFIVEPNHSKTSISYVFFCYGHFYYKIVTFRKEKTKYKNKIGFTF